MTVGFQQIPNSAGDVEDTFGSGGVKKNVRPFGGALLPTLAYVAAILSSLLSFMIFFDVHPNVSESFRPSTAPQNRVLRRPSTYVNLDKIPRNASKPLLHPIIGFPDVVMQFDNSDPSKLLREDDRMHNSDVGMIFPDERHFLVSAETSTVMQFRNIDFGMENCTLDPTIPDSSHATFDTAINIDKTSVVDIWMVDSSIELFSSSLRTRATRAPSRISHFASIDFSGTGHKAIEFYCPSTSFTTFEFSCADHTPNCHVEFWQKKGNPPNGVYMVQHDSSGTWNTV